MAIERLVFFYLPRICNHCLNPSCVAACPSGALYKRGEDGIVLVDQQRCRGWRACVAACPYKKVFLQLAHGQIGEVHPLLPAPRNGAGAGLLPLLRRPHSLPRACCSTTPTGSKTVAKTPDAELIDGHRDMILDPHDPEVIAAARAQRHPRLGDRVGPEVARLPVRQGVEARAAAAHRVPHAADAVLRAAAVAGDVDAGGRDDRSRLAGPVPRHRPGARADGSSWPASSAPGNEGKVRYALAQAEGRPHLSARGHGRRRRRADGRRGAARGRLHAASEAEAIYRLTSLCTFDDRFVIPPMHREEAIEMMEDPHEWKQEAGFGFRHGPKRSVLT